MVCVTLWLQLLLLVLLLRQSAALSYQCSELQEVIFRLERDLVSMRELKNYAEFRADKCHEQLQTKIDGLKKTVDLINQAVQILFEKQEPQTTINGVAKTVESLNQTSQLRCGTTEDVCRSLLDAAKSGDVNRTMILLKYSNDNCTDNDRSRNTPLTYAAIYGHVEVLRVLLEGGAYVDRANDYGFTALHRAAMYGHLDVCRLLLDWGAKVDRLNWWQHTPLYFSARENHLSVVKLLVARGADVSAKDDIGQTASDVARSLGYKPIADWLDNVRHG